MTVDPAELTAANLLYRDPALYDLMFGSEHADLVRALVDAHAPTARTVIDFGCGTGRDIDALGARFACVGVDAQPGLVEFAHAVRPHVDIRVGDLCSVRLGHSADVLLCLGNVLAYLHDDRALTAAFATFAAHAHPGTLLIIETLTTPPATRRSQHPSTVHGTPAQVTIDTRYDADTGIAAADRTWTVDGQVLAVDRLRRRVAPVCELHRLLAAAGFTPLPTDVSGSSAVIATRT